MEISNEIQEMQPVDAKSLGFLAVFEDGSQIDATGDVDAMGVTIGTGRLDDEGEWSEIRISWQALQAVADELNEMLRQARKADWL
jgi:hypothetical protein